jgi:hypothetical protein
MEGGKKHTRLGDIEAYRISFHLSNRVWDIDCKCLELV